MLKKNQLADFKKNVKQGFNLLHKDALIIWKNELKYIKDNEPFHAHSHL